MTGNQATCPQCGATTVGGQLVPTKNAAGGILTAILTDDMAAGVLVAQSGRLAVQAFCLSCGAIWLPLQEYMRRAIRGELGQEPRGRVRRELEEMVKQGTGFKLVSEEAARAASWAKGLLSES
jgi:hypothetical protein